MAQFSGAIKIADGFDDYLAPAQNCVLPMASKNKGDAVTIMDTQDELGFTDFMVSVDIKSTKRKVVSSSVSAVEGANFGQITNTADKATITLNDCLACSGCVTSAETILITQQSTDEFQRVLAGVRARRAAIAAGTDNPSLSPYKAAVVSVSPQSLASIAELFSLSLPTCADLLNAFFVRMGASLVVGTLLGQHIALREAQHEFEQRYINRIKAAAVSSLLSAPSTSTTVSATLSSSALTTDISSLPAAHPARDTLAFAHASARSVTLPLLCSECPGWTVFAEKTQGEKVLGHMSGVKSPMELTGMLLKDVLLTTHVSTAEDAQGTAALHGDEVYHVSITPCYDKKLEAARQDYERGRREEAGRASGEGEAEGEQRTGLEVSMELSTDPAAATETAPAANLIHGTTVSARDPLRPSRAVDVVLATSELVDLLLGLSTVVAEDNMTMTTRSSSDARGRACWSEVWRTYSRGVSAVDGAAGEGDEDRCGAGAGMLATPLATPLATATITTPTVGGRCCEGNSCSAITTATTAAQCCVTSEASTNAATKHTKNADATQTSGYATPSAPLTKLRVPGTGSSGNYADYIFRTTSLRMFGVQIPEEALPWCAGTNSDLKAVSLEYLGTGTCVHTIAAATAPAAMCPMIDNDAQHSASVVDPAGVTPTQTVGLYALIGAGKSSILPGKVIPEASSTLTPWKRTAKYRLWRAKTASVATSESHTTSTASTTSISITSSVAAQAHAQTITCTLTTPLAAPAVLLWVACAQGFRNVQNVIKQGPAAANYDYVEVLACPSGCSNGGGQIRAVDMGRLRSAFAQVLDGAGEKGVEDDVEGGVSAATVSANDGVDAAASAGADGNDGAAVSVAVKRIKARRRAVAAATPAVGVDDELDMGMSLDSAVAHQPTTTTPSPAPLPVPSTPDAGSSLQAQKALVARLDALMNTLPVAAPEANALLQCLYAQVWGGEGSDRAVLGAHTHFRALDTNNTNILPKW